MSIYPVKGSQKFNDVKSILLFNLFETAITLRMFSPIIAPRFFCI